MSISTKEKAAPARTATHNYPNQSNKSTHKPQSNLDKSGLTSPSVVLDVLGIKYKLSIAGLGVHCPFHKGGKEHNPSLLMNTKYGHYKCFACGAKGGDVIAFYRAVTGAGFVEALKALGVHHA